MTSAQEILSSGFDQLDADQSVSLDSVARAVGLTKPGVMHHFPTKEALMVALVDAVLDRWEGQLTARLDDSVAPTAVERARAYLEWSLSGEFHESDLVMMSDPKLRRPLTSRWAERMLPWLAFPDEFDLDRRARLTAVRLLADGAWVSSAVDLYPPDSDERARIRTLALNLLED
jgi:AcrR family transcriptional regulator